MKKYYIHDGKDQQGLFDIKELKEKKITKETSIWYEGLPDWTSADQVDELKDLFIVSTPPPFKGGLSTPPPINKQPTQPEPERKSTQTVESKSGRKNGSKLSFIGLAIVVFFVGVLIFNNINQNNTSGETYQEKVMTVEEIERSQPTNFLTASGTYEENFWGNKLKVHGLIKNTATVASYKDAIVRITYYSKTQSAIGSKDYPIYEIFPPHSEKTFELKIDKYKDVKSIGWEVIEAKSL